MKFPHLIKEHESDPSKRIVQKKLAEEVTKFVHGEEEYLKAVNTTQKLFDQQHASAESLSVEDLESMEGIVRVNYEKNKLESGVEIVNFLAETMILPSKGEARKMVQNSGISINRKKVDSQEFKLKSSHLLHDKYILVQKGKKNYYLVEAV
jgi:tyrosyl-tRNA synthetase